jgi:D-sedoheptulose 7-phosphate isomerase
MQNSSAGPAHAWDTAPETRSEFTDYLRHSRAVAAAMADQEVQELAATVMRHLHSGTVLIAGNGGSACTADHWAVDLQAGADSRQWTGSVRSLTSNSGVLTRLGNDVSYDQVFAHQLRHVQPPALLIALTVSGRSPNLVRAVEAAQAAGLESFAVAGLDGPVSRLSKYSLVVDSADYGIVEDIHLQLLHWLSRRLLGGPMLVPQPESSPPPAEDPFEAR